VVSYRYVISDSNPVGQIEKQRRGYLAILSDLQQFPYPPRSVKRHAAKHHGPLTDPNAHCAIDQHADSIERKSRTKKEDRIRQPQPRMKCVEIADYCPYCAG
jgi:hypothetical protein